MSLPLIQKYYSDVEQLRKYSHRVNESTISHYFGDLINAYAEKNNLKLIRQLDLKTSNGKTIRPEGVLKNILRIDYGYWESKYNVDLQKEISNKIRAGYPLVNTIFEDGNTAILYQKGEEVLTAQINDEQQLHTLLARFTGYEHPQVTEFNQAIERFKQDLPHVLDALRNRINLQEKTNPEFTAARNRFLAICRESINPEISLDDVNEMLLQHILTEEIFVSIFGEADYHRENNIARELYKVEETFFTGKPKKDTLDSISSYYEVIKANASTFADYHEKQRFLKVIYENFYKAYNPKAADKLGVVYTPNEVVSFMVAGVNALSVKYFDKTISENGVEILDPATGTGTFVCELLERMHPRDLKYKYQNEIHANEIAILPYYIANLNIEATYRSLKEEYEEFQNLCLMDTIDNDWFNYSNKQTSMFGVTAENAKRIKRQNDKKISIVIGNPPYNAKQENYNFQNANRAYKQIDKEIKDTYVKLGSAQNQIVLYDMYVRFFRWATKRINENGIVAFVTNRNFIDGRAFDGFRKSISKEFNYGYVFDLGGDVRANPKLSGSKHNVFGIQTGVAISFFVKQKDNDSPCKIFYERCDEFATAEEKLDKLSSIFTHFNVHAAFENSFTQQIYPDKDKNWINQTDNDFDTLMPLIDKEVKGGKAEQAVFKMFSRGVETTRDEWVYDLNKDSLLKKAGYFIEKYNASVKNREMNMKIKWSSSLEASFNAAEKIKLNNKLVRKSLYRPYFKMFHYTEKLMNHRLTANHYEMFSEKLDKENLLLCVSGIGSSKPFQALVSDKIVGLDTLEKTQCLPLYRYTADGVAMDNITDWALAQFIAHYQPAKAARYGKPDAGTAADNTLHPATEWAQPHLADNAHQYLHEPEGQYGLITKQQIFNYCYAVLHNPAYRTKYETNLKREFPRIPFYANFWQWAAWGETLINLHLGYETAQPYALKLNEIVPDTDAKGYEALTKSKLKADKENGTIEIDGITTLTGIPAQAWQYKLGNRSALEWVLDQYKDYKPADPTIAAEFNTYHFADYKTQVIDLLKRVTTVSLSTMQIIAAMENGEA